MRDYLKRLLIAGLMALCVSLLFLGGKHSQAATFDIAEATKDWVWPSDGTITDMFGTRNGQHKGIDIAAEYGSSIYAVDGGKVMKSYYSASYGHVIFIKHPNDTETVYAHLKKRLVSEGQKVEQGEQIGEMGNTGDSSGVHLHFEVHKNEWTFDKKNAINPTFALGEGKVGQVVYALHKRSNKEDVIEASARPQIAEVNEQIKHKKGNLLNVSAEKSIDKGKSKELIYSVKQGDTLWSISKRYQTTVESIKRSNSISSDEIKTNQKLKIPTENQKQYLVQKGDTLFSIARKTNTSINKIKALNQLPNDRIMENDIIILP